MLRSLGGAAVAALLLASSVQASTPTLFHTDAGPPYNDPAPLVPPYPPGGSHTLNLVLNPGSVIGSGTICDNGTGDQTCGVYLEITVDGDLSIPTNGFTPLVSSQETHMVQGNKTLRVAMVTTASPLPPGSTRLGTLTVDSGPSGGSVRVMKVQTVDASLDLMTGAPRTIAYIPEPGFGLGLAAGVAALGLLGWRRAWAGAAR